MNLKLRHHREFIFMQELYLGLFALKETPNTKHKKGRKLSKKKKWLLQKANNRSQQATVFNTTFN